MFQPINAIGILKSVNNVILLFDFSGFEKSVLISHLTVQYDVLSLLHSYTGHIAHYLRNLCGSQSSGC